MPRADPVQFNVRSAFVRDRAAQLARGTGMSATRVIEEALRAYAPPPPPPIVDDDNLPLGLIRKGGMLVLTGGPRVSLEETTAMIEEGRNRGGLIHDDDDE